MGRWLIGTERKVCGLGGIHLYMGLPGTAQERGGHEMVGKRKRALHLLSGKTGTKTESQDENA